MVQYVIHPYTVLMTLQTDLTTTDDISTFIFKSRRGFTPAGERTKETLSSLHHRISSARTRTQDSRIITTRWDRIGGHSRLGGSLGHVED